MATNDGGFIGQDGLNAPDLPTGVSATAGDTEATISFTAPSDVGGSAITGYRAQSNDGIGASGSSSPITVTGLTNGTSYTFNVWAINAFGYSAPSDASGSVAPYAPEAFFNTGSSNSDLEKVLIGTLGNATDFGDIGLIAARSGIASSTRGIFTTGTVSGQYSNTIEYFEVSAGGTLADFGDLTVARKLGFGVASSTRGVSAGANSENTGTGQPENSNVMDYVTIASTGNATDFGDLTVAGGPSGGGCSPTRGVFMGRFFTSGSSNVIDYITIASTGNATDFGDAGGNRKIGAGASNSTRAIAAGMDNNVIEYVTIASTGNATDFGDLLASNEGQGGCASSTRMLIAGGASNSSRIEYIEINTTGNASDFGDLNTAGINGMGALSNAHGGLQ
jgi:hypothetical protein